MGDVASSARAEEPPEEEGWRGREAKTRGGRSNVVWTPEILRKESETRSRRGPRGEGDVLSAAN